MPVVSELIRIEDDGTISFGNYMLAAKSKLQDFEFQGDLYKVKTFGDDGLEREIKMADKLKALELLGKHMGMFKDKVELSGVLDSEKTKLDDLLQQMRGDG